MRWKTFAGRCIYQGTHGIRVYQNIFFRWLRFDSRALQSLINRYFPARPELYYLKPLISMAEKNPGNCCILGLGGAGAVHALTAPLRAFHITVVESEAEVIAVAERFFMTKQLSNVTIIHQDASEFVQHSQDQFAHLLVDLFNADCFPHHCNNETFFSHCQRLLTSEGILAVNLANSYEQKPILEIIRRLFCRNTLVIPVKRSANIIILASNQQRSSELADFLIKQQLIKKVCWDSEWGYVGRM